MNIISDLIFSLLSHLQVNTINEAYKYYICAKRIFSLTNSKKSVKLYTDNVLDAFYEAIRTNSLDRLHIPHSDVFYVRQAVEAHYGRKFTLKHVEDAMRAEGWKEPNEQ